MNSRLSENSYYGLLIVFFLVVFVQFANVYYFHDDYGMMTLSYAWIEIPNVNGTSFGIWELLQFLYEMYATWTGRVLYFFVEIVLGFKNIWILRVTEALVITSIVAFMIRERNNNLISALVVLIAYFSLSRTVTADGLYWYTASVIYVFPMLPFFIGCSLFYRICFARELERNEKYLMSISLFCAAFSQEQISCATVSFVTVCWLLMVIRSPRQIYGARRDYAVAIACAYVGFILLVAAPGNWKRAALEQMTLMERFLNHGDLLLLYQYLADGHIYQTLLLTINILMGLYLFKNKAAHRAFLFVSVSLSVFLLVLNARYLSGCNNGVMQITDYNRPITVAILIAHFSTVVATVFFFCKNIKGRMDTFLFLFAGVVSLLVMLVVPSAVPYRSALPFFFIMIFVLSDMARFLFKSEKYKQINVAWLVVVGVLGVANYAGIVDGYATNGVVHKTNDLILKATSEKISSGDSVEKVTLYKSLDNRYGGALPYEKMYIQRWIKTYYQLPPEIELNYVDYIRGPG